MSKAEGIRGKVRETALTIGMVIMCPGDDIALSAGIVAQVAPGGESSHSVPHDAVFPKGIEIKAPPTMVTRLDQKGKRSVRPHSRYR